MSLRGADDAGSFETIHVGHFDVHQNQVEFFQGKFLDGFFAVDGGSHTVPGRFENFCDQAAVYGVIFRHQDGKMRSARAGWRK